MATDDFFRARLDSMIDLRHPLAVLATRMPWAEIEAWLAPALAHKDRAGKLVDGADLFGATAELIGAGVSARGRQRLPIRLMVALLYLKHAFNLSDEELVERWSENVQWQFFSGQAYYEPRLPCDATQIGRFRRVLGEAGVEQLLKTTLEAAVAMKLVKKTEFERVIVDTTVQEKAIAHPTDSRLLEIARHKVASAAKRVGIIVKQTFAKQGKQLRRKAGGYAHAKQFRRLARTVKRQRTILGCLMRDVQRGVNRILQAGCGGCIGAEQRGAGRAGHLAGARRAHPHAAAPRQAQALRIARARGRVHRLGSWRASPMSSASRSAWRSRTSTA
jgi:transposase, IS5 family